MREHGLGDVDRRAGKDDALVREQQVELLRARIFLRLQQNVALQLAELFVAPQD